MGNHEYCQDCGLSSFHYGEPCPPKAYRKHQAEKKAIERRNKQASEAAEKLAEDIRKTYNVNVEIHDFGLKIWKYQFVKKNKDTYDH